MVDEALGADYLEHLRRSWIRVFHRWIPYPFQNNLRHLPQEILYECLVGLYEVSLNAHGSPRHFEDWIVTTFGEGIARHFMVPYNRKVWSTPLGEMSKDWIEERVSVVDFVTTLRNVIMEEDDIGWGPNSTFRFPLKGGTGVIFRKLAAMLDGHIHLNRRVTRIDPETKTLGYADGSTSTYDILVSTMPLDQLIGKLTSCADSLREAAGKLIANRVMVVGIGFDRGDPSEKTWMYFPENDTPCYRVTHFSSYSPYNVPDSSRSFSLMGEISYARDRVVKDAQAVDATLDGFVNAGLIADSDRRRVMSVFTHTVDYAYPVPTLERDRALSRIQPYLETRDIYSRGRFGGWKYEVGNMDHSVMQGVEVIDRILRNERETVLHEDLGPAGARPDHRERSFR
jgi:protoporphyrinogen oxidase